MAANEETCDGNPNFAIICSFITKFGHNCGVNILVPDLQQMLEDTKNVHKDLQEVLIHLLRRGRKRVNKEKWEKCLIKFCHEYSSVDAWELERFGFLKSKLSVKLEVLKRLLELQFDANAKFKAEVNKHDASSLRILPLGRDIDGQAYWYQLDKEFNMRLYRETIGEDGEWKLLCSTTEDLRILLTNLEKKYSSSPGTCESKPDDLNNPKSPTSDIPVPKKELDTEDLTSCLSDTKPCTIIIKTEKRDSVSHLEMPNCVKNDSSAIVNDTVNKMEISQCESNTKVCVKLKLKLEPATNSKTDQKSEKDVLDSNAEYKRSAIVVSDPEPMVVEIVKTKEADTVSLAKSVSINDIEMKDLEDLKVEKSKSEDHTDQNCSSSKTKSTVDIEKSDTLNHHKSSKIKLYEKWSNEKKKLDGNHMNTEECKKDKILVMQEEDKCKSVTSNENDDPAILQKSALEQSSNSEHADKIEALAEQTIIADVEMAVDLSKSSRVNVIVQNTCSKPVLSNGVPLKLSHEKKLGDDVIAINSTSTETVKKSESSEDKASKMSTDFKYQLHEAETNKFHKKSQIFTDRYDSPASTNSGSGFSHLQALQNMCESNAMGGIPRIILSTNRQNTESNRTVISESKAVTNSNIDFETISEKYNYNEAHCLREKTHGADCEATDILLKSNVHKTDENKDKKELDNELQVGSNSPDFKASMKKQEVTNRHSEALPTDLSYPTGNKSKTSELKSNLSENLDKTESSSVNEKNSALRTQISSDIKETLKLDDEIHNDKKKDELNGTNISPVNESEINLIEDKITTSCDSSQNKTLSKTSMEDKNINKSSDGKNYLKEQITENSSKNTAESTAIENCKNEMPCKLPALKNLHKEVTSASLHTEKYLSENELVNDQAKNIKVAGCNVSDSSDKSQSEPIKEPNSEASNSLVKESETEILTDKNEVSKSTDCVLQESKNKLLKVSTDSVCSSSFKSNLKVPKNDLAGDFSSVNLVSADTENKSSLDAAAVGIVDKNQKSVMKLKPTDISPADEKNSSCENDADKNIPSELYVSVECSVTNNETILSEKIKSDEQIKNDTKEKLSELKRKSDDHVSTEKKSHVTDSSQTSELVSRNDEEFETRMDVKTTETKCFKTAECDVSKLDANNSKLIGVSKELLKSDKETVSEKKDCSGKFNKFKESNKYLSNEKDSVLKIKDCIANSKKGEKREKVLQNDDTLSEKKECEEKPGIIKANALNSDVSVLEEKSKNLEESGKSFNNEEGSILEKSKEIGATEKTLNSNEISKIEKTDCKEKSKEIEKSEKAFSDEENFQKVESEYDLNSEKENGLGKATCNEKSKTMENEKDNILKRMDLKEKQKKIEFEEGLNEKVNVSEQKDLKEKPKQFEIEKCLNNEKDNILEKKDIKGKPKKIEINEVNVLEQKDLAEKPKQFEIEEGLNDEKDNILEKKDLKRKPKRIEFEEGLNNEKDNIIEKMDLKEKPKRIEIEKSLNNETVNVLEKEDLKEKPKQIVIEKCLNNEKDNMLEKKDLKGKPKKNDIEKGLNKKVIPEQKDLKEKPKQLEIEEGLNNEKDNILEKKDLNEKSKTNEIEKCFNNQEENILEKKDLNEKPKTSENEKCFNNEKDNILEKKVLKEKPKKTTEIEKDNILEKRDLKGNPKKIEIEKGLNNEKVNILENKDLIEKPKKFEIEKSLSNEKDNILEKRDLNEKPKTNEIEKCFNNEKDNLLEKKDLKEKPKKIQESEHLNKDVNSVSEKKKTNDKSKKSASMKESKFLETEKELKKKDSDKCLPKTDAKNISESVLFQKKDKSLVETKCNARNSKNSEVDNLDTKDHLTVLSLKEKEDSKEDLSIPSMLESASSNEEKECNKSNKSKILSKSILLREQFNVYNLRHITCLETKFKHPSCDKYIKKAVEPKLITSECPAEIKIEYESHSNEVSTPKIKKQVREKNVKQLVDKKSQLNAKTTAPIKKTPVSIAKKLPSRNRKKVNDDEKLDFSIPEGFLEILGNAEKSASETGTIKKKRKGFELKEAPGSHQSSENESTPIKRSRRIQEQHQKKMTELAVEMEREQRMLEQMAKRSNSVKKNKTTPQKSPVKLNIKGSNTKLTNTPVKSLKTRTKIPEPEEVEDTCMESRRATRKMNSRSKNLTKMTLLYEDESKDSEFSTSRETEKSKKRRRGRGLKKGFKPWDVSSESSSSLEELTEEEEEEEEPEEILIFDVNEDEFACEEVDPNAEPVITRRARTAKKNEVQNTTEECINDDTPCKKCGKYDKPDWILLCDKCDSGYHTHCLIPPLMLVPDGDWFCQPCEHMSLCQCLHEELNKLEVILKQKEREELRKQRLAYVGISLDNVLKPEKKEKTDESSKEEQEEEEQQQQEEETENEQENQKPHKPKKSFEDEQHQKLYGKRSVRARTTVNYQFKEYDELIFSALQEDMIEVPEEFKEAGSEAESDKPFTAKISKKKKKNRRFKDFDSDDEDSGEEYQGGSTDSEATAPPSSHSDQESGSGEWKVVKSRKKPQRKSGSRRRGGDSSEEDWDEEEVDNDIYRPTTRRAAQKAISYREISSEEEEWGVAKPRLSLKRRKTSSSESEASFKRKTSKKKRIRKWASSDSSEESEEEKSMSSSGESEDDDDESQEEGSGNEFKIDRQDKPRLKSNANKKVLSTDEEESSTRDSAPKEKTKKIISDESEDEEEEEESDSEDEDEEEEEDEDEDDDDDEEDEEEKTEKKPAVPEKKVSPINQNLSVNNSESNAEKKGISNEKLVSGAEKQAMSINKETSLSTKENEEFQPKVLVKKELCSVDIPLEPMKQPVMFSAANEKAPPKIARKDTTKMVPCVIPYEKSPKSVPASNFEEESGKEVLRREEEMPHPIPPSRPMSFPKHGVPFMSPPSRIQFGGVLARHSVPPFTPSARPPVHPRNMQSRFIAPTNLLTRPPAPSSVVQHHMPHSRLPVRSTVPVTNMSVVQSAPHLTAPSTQSAPRLTAPSTQTAQNKSESKPYKSTIMEPFSNMDEENDTDDEVPLERIPTACVPAPLPNRPVSYEKETEYRPAAKDLPSYSYAPPEEKPYPASYSSLASFQDYSTRPSPLKPSLVETYPNNSSPSKLTPLDTYSQTSSPKGFISLDSYSENRKKKHFYGNTSQEPEPPHRPVPPSSENYQGGEIRFPPEPYPSPQSPNTFSHRSPPPNQRDPGTPPRLYSQFPDAYAPPRSPEYYQNHQYYASEERIARPSYQPNYAPQEPSFISNPYVATPVPQPNGGFMIDTLLRARNHEEGEDELTGVTDIVSYITQE